MGNGSAMIFLVLFLLFTMQAVGGYFQIQNYKTAIWRIRQFGEVGIGQKRGGFLNGYLVLIACGEDGVITAIEVMEGLTFLARFRPRSKIIDIPAVGNTVKELLAQINDLTPKQKKRYKGYLQALEMLDEKLTKEKL